MEFFFVLHRSLLTLVGRRALVCFDKVSITLTSARKLNYVQNNFLRLLNGASYINIYFFSSFVIYLSLESYWGAIRAFEVLKGGCHFFYHIFILWYQGFFFLRPYPCLRHVSYCPKVRSGFVFFKLVLLFYLTSSIIQNLPQKNAVSRNCL